MSFWVTVCQVTAGASAHLDLLRSLPVRLVNEIPVEPDGLLAVTCREGFVEVVGHLSPPLGQLETESFSRC